MIVQFDETQIMLRDTVSGLCADLRGAPRLQQEKRAALWREFAELGWTGVALPERHGGSEGSLVDAGIIALELGRAGLYCGYPETVALATALADVEAADELLAAAAGGRLSLAMALQLDSPDPLGGIMPDRPSPGLLTEAAAAETTLIELVAGDVPLLIALPSPVARSAMTTTRQADRALDLASAAQGGSVLLRGEAAVAAWSRAQAIFRCLASAELAGAGRQLLDMSIEYAGVRVQFGKPIGTFQAVQHALAETLAACEGAELATFKALSACDCGADSRDMTVCASIAFVREAVWAVLMKSYDVLGGVGYMEEHPFSRYVRGLLPLLASLGTAELCEEHAAETVRKGAWVA